MMIADLIDDDDFRMRLVALGIRIPENAGPETCARMALREHAENGVPGLEELIHDLMACTGAMLPSVRQAIEHYLLGQCGAPSQ